MKGSLRSSHPGAGHLSNKRPPAGAVW